MESYAATMQQLYQSIGQSCLLGAVVSIPTAFCPWLQTTPTYYPCPPWVVKMEGFQEKDHIQVWYSDPVYSHIGGYKACLKVYTTGDCNANGTHVSVFICLMRGDNDAILKWPFKGTIKVSLLNQLEDGQCYMTQPWSPDDDIPECTSGSVAGEERANSGWGHPQLISHQDLTCRANNKLQYLKDNTLFFRVDCFEPYF